MSEKVSIIVPVYNTDEKLLINSIKSITSQTYSNLQVLVIDDGSCEDTALVCDSLKLLDDRIEVIHTGNKGASNARNIGVDKAEGKYCMFADSDDCLVDDLVEIFVKEIEKCEVDCVICGCEQTADVEQTDIETKKNYSIKILSRQEMMDNLIYIGQPFESIEMTAVWGTIYKTELLKQQEFDVDIAIGEDFLYKFNYFRRINRLACIDKIGYIYHLVETGIMRSGFNQKKVDSISQFQKILDKESKSEYFDGLLSRAVNIAFVVLISIPDGSQYDAKRSEVEAFIKKYRKSVLKNKKTRKKVRIAIYISYFSFKLVKKAFGLAK